MAAVNIVLYCVLYTRKLSKIIYLINSCSSHTLEFKSISLVSMDKNPLGFYNGISCVRSL